MSLADILKGEISDEDDDETLPQPPSISNDPYAHIKHFATYEWGEIIPDVALIREPKDERTKKLVLHKTWIYAPIFCKDLKLGNRIWTVGFDVNQGEIVTWHGIFCMAIQKSSHKITPKGNRTLHEQAVQDVNKMYMDKFRKGYRPFGVEEPEVKKPMCANTWREGVTRLSFPVGIQAKFDGNRLMVRRGTDSQPLIYRTRNNLQLNHLAPFFDESLLVLLSYLPSGIELNGEIYKHGESLQVISGIFRANVNVKEEDLKRVSFIIFDYGTAEEIPFEKRWLNLINAIEKYWKATGDRERIKIAYTHWVYSSEEIKRLHDKFVDMGYEGAMIYKTHVSKPTPEGLKEALYKPGRVNNILKCKKFIDTEGIVVRVKAGEGKCEDQAILDVRLATGVEFTIGGFKVPAEVRREWLRNSEIVLGKILKFKYSELSDKGVPLHATGLCLRDHEGYTILDMPGMEPPHIISKPAFVSDEPVKLEENLRSFNSIRSKLVSIKEGALQQEAVVPYIGKTIEQNEENSGEEF